LHHEPHGHRENVTPEPGGNRDNKVVISG